MRSSPRRAALALAALATFTLSCGDPDGPGAVGAVAVRGPAALRVGDTATVTAEITDARGNPMTGVGVRWEVAPDSVLRIAAGGELTALKEGTAHVVASAGGRSGALDVVVQFRQGVPELLSVTPTHGLLVVGQSLALDARVRDREGTRVDTATKRWSLSDSTLATIDAQGTVRAKRGGLLTVSLAVDTMRAVARVVVVPPVARVVLYPDTLRVDAGGSASFAYEALDASAAPLGGRVASWRSLDLTVATVDQNGRVSVSGAAGASARIVATVEGVADTAIARIAVGAATAADVSPQSSVLGIGGTATLAGRLLSSTGVATTGVAGTWASADTTVATVSAAGVVTGRGPGATEIVFTSGTLQGRHWTKVEGDPASVELLVDTLRSTLNFAYAANTGLPLRVLDASGQQVLSHPIAWTADDPAIMNVANGYVQATAVGTTLLRGRVGTVDFVLPVRVGSVPPPAIGFSESMFVAVVNTALPVRVGSGAGVEQTISLVSTDPRVATVSPTSVTTSGWADVTITAVGPGSATIRAIAPTSMNSMSINVVYPAVGSVRVTNPPGTVRVGNTYPLRAEVVAATGGVQPWVPVWRSLAPDIATVAHDGTLTALAPGSTTVIASLGGRADTIRVDVQPLSAPRVTAITPAILLPGETATIDGAGFDEAAAAGNRVTIAGVPVTVTAATASRLTVLLPAAASFPCAATRPVRVTVTAGGLTGDTLHPLRAARQQPLLPNGGSVTLTGRDATCIELAPGAQRWLATIANPTASVGQRATLRLWGEPSTFAAGTAPAAGTLADLVMPATTGAGVLRPDAEWRRRAEARHREALAVAPAMVRRFGMRALVSATPSSAAASLPGAGDVAQALAQPKLGAIVTMRVPLFTLADYCSEFAEVKARVVAVGTRTVLLEDVDAPAARQMDTELGALAVEVNDLMLEPSRLMVGDPLKLDATRGGAGRVAVLVTRALNDFGARNEVIGSGCDLVSRAVAPASNEVPVVYMTAPMSADRGFSTSDTRDYWLWVLRGRVMHELAHLAMNAERFSRGRYPDEYWLDEALAAVAVESYGRRFGGAAWKGDARYEATLYCEVRPVTLSCNGRPLVMYDQFAWLYEYGRSSSARSPIGQAFAGDGAFLGGGWWLLRWAIDQYATDERAFVQALVNEPSLSGVANLQARTGHPMSEMLPDFGGTLLLGSIAPLVPARVQMTVPSWNWSNVWRGMASDFTDFSGLPLSLRYHEGASFDSGPFTVQGGTVETVDLRGTKALPQLLGITGPGGAPAPTNLVVQLLRAQ